MKKKLVACISILISFLIVNNCIGQDKLLSNFDLLNHTIIEKVFLHIDRDFYAPGDVIWYKAYLLNDISFSPSVDSWNLHVELVSKDGQIIENNLSLLQNGMGQGHIKINDSIPEGDFVLRAYTNYMRNLNDKLFFHRTISIKNTDTSKNRKEENKNQMIDLQFMPESGDLIANVLSKVAFKAIDNNGKPFNFKGELYNSKNQKLSEISSMHDGMGFFQLKPLTGEKYYIKVTQPELPLTYKLPDICERGIALSVSSMSKDNIEIFLSANPEGFTEQRIKMVFHTRGNIAGINNIILKQPYKKLSIPKNRIPPGISCVTIMNMKNVPLAERLVYNKQDNQFFVSIKTNKTNYYPREKVIMEIETKDQLGNPVQANFSLSVTDKIALAKDFQDTPDIFSYFFLTSNFRGTIENPSYYFTDQDEQKLLHLDLVLLTHGWRKFIWKEVSEGDLNLQNDYEKGLTLKGNYKPTAKKLDDNRITISSFDEGFFFVESTPDSLGNFCFENLVLRDSTTLIIETYDRKKKISKKVEISQDKYQPAPFQEIPELKNCIKPPENYNEFALERINATKNTEFKSHVFLDEFIVKSTQNKSIYKPKDNHHRFSIIKPSNVIDFDDILVESNQRVLDILMSRVPGIQRYTFDTLIIRGGFASGKKLKPTPPLYFLDGVRISYDYFQNIPTETIDKIEVLKGLNQTNIYGPEAIGGVINVYSRNLEAPVSKEKDTGTLHYDIKGFQRIRQFYSPNYANRNERIKHKDQRITIYWSPNINTGPEGKTTVSFYTADRETTYFNLLQGISNNGKLGFSESEIKVNEN